jgi:hypothetical protein
MAGKENPVETTTIVQNCMLLLVKHVLWKKNEEEWKKNEKQNKNQKINYGEKKTGEKVRKKGTGK